MASERWVCRCEREFLVSVSPMRAAWAADPQPGGPTNALPPPPPPPSPLTLRRTCSSCTQAMESMVAQLDKGTMRGMQKESYMCMVI